MVQVCAHLWAMQQLLFCRAFPCSQDAQLLVHKHMPRAGFLYEYGRPAGAARARVNRDSRNELMELHATQKVCHRRAALHVTYRAELLENLRRDVRTLYLLYFPYDLRLLDGARRWF